MGCHNLYGCTILVFYNSFCCNYVLAGKAELLEFIPGTLLVMLRFMPPEMML